MTMKTPEMEVVRFTESDVMCASGLVEHTNVRIANLGLAAVGDATWTYTNGSTEVISFGKYESDKKHGTLKENVVYHNGSNSTTLGEIVNGGDADGLFIEFNGLYETLDSGKSWHKVQ